MNTFKSICLITLLTPVIVLAQPANKTTQTISRLKAEVKVRNNPNDYRVDSTTYFYARDNAWDEQLKTWKFDSTHYYVAINKGMPKMAARTIQDVGANINSMIFQQFSSATNLFINRSKAFYTYNNGKVAEILVQSYVPNTQMWQDREKILMYYNSNGQLTDSLTLHLTSSGWDSSERTRYTYGPDGKTSWLVESKNNPGDWVEFFKGIYTYGNGKITELNFGNTYRMRYIYDNNGINTEVQGERWNASTSSWIVGEITYYTLDVNGNILTEEYDGTLGGWGRWKSATTYNSYNQPVHTRYEIWNGGWQPNGDSTDKYFYYEEVFPSSVEKINKAFSAINLYPVPATNVLTIDIMQQQASEVIFSIYAIDGKILRQWNQPVTGKEYKEAISIADIPTGNYILKVSSNKGEISKQFTVSR